MVVDVFLKPLETVVNLLFSRHDRKEDREAKTEVERRIALSSLFDALRSTIAYNETLPAGRDRAKELELSTLWYAAMGSCRPYFEDQDVFWMWHKSLFWLNGSGPGGGKIAEEELKRLLIDLPTVRNKVEEMILEGRPKKHMKPQGSNRRAL